MLCWWSHHISGWNVVQVVLVQEEEWRRTGGKWKQKGSRAEDEQLRETEKEIQPWRSCRANESMPVFLRMCRSQNHVSFTNVYKLPYTASLRSYENCTYKCEFFSILEFFSQFCSLTGLQYASPGLLKLHFCQALSDICTNSTLLFYIICTFSGVYAFPSLSSSIFFYLQL